MRKFVRVNRTSEDSLDNGSIVLPVDSFKGGYPESDTALILTFTPLARGVLASGQNNFLIRLTITANTHRDVLDTVVKEFSTGSAFEIILADVETSTYLDSRITGVEWDVSPQISYDIGWNGSRTKIKIIPSDFVADDGGRPVMTDDASSDRWIESNGTDPMYASIAIPMGFKATHVNIYGSGTSAINVYEANINSKTVTSRGTGNIQTPITITAVTSSATNYLLIQLLQTSGEEVYGGYVTIALK